MCKNENSQLSINLVCTLFFEQSVSEIPRRSKAEQEVLAFIAPLGKLGCFEEAADFFQANA